MKHELKIELPYYKAVVSGDKTFEIRYNDRGYQKGDIVTLMPTEFRSKYPDIDAYITYVSNYAQKEGWVVFGIKLIQSGQSTNS